MPGNMDSVQSMQNFQRNLTDRARRRKKDKRMFLKKRKNRFIAVFCVILLCSFLLTGCGSTSIPDGTCTISIECSAILDHMDDLKETKKEFVPEDGWILKETQVSFKGGETAFDVLKQVCGRQGIHMASRYTPLYKSHYVEGINQIYEFDCGKNSGWMYSVNGTYPNYGASSYKLKDGDKVEWRYTCDLGSDVGDQYAEDRE